MKVAWTARRSNQSIFREINPEYSLEGLMLQPLRSSDAHRRLMEKPLMLGKIKGRRRGGRQRMRWRDRINAMNLNLGKLRDGEGQGGLVCCSPWGRSESDTTGLLSSKERGKHHVFIPIIVPEVCAIKIITKNLNFCPT